MCSWLAISCNADSLDFRTHYFNSQPKRFRGLIYIYIQVYLFSLTTRGIFKYTPDVCQYIDRHYLHPAILAQSLSTTSSNKKNPLIAKDVDTSMKQKSTLEHVVCCPSKAPLSSEVAGGLSAFKSIVSASSTLQNFTTNVF